MPDSGQLVGLFAEWALGEGTIGATQAQAAFPHGSRIVSRDTRTGKDSRQEQARAHVPE
jgi:hypothetical protein